MENVWSILKELYKNKQTRALIYLGFWGLFLIFVFAALNSSTMYTPSFTNPKTTLNALESFRVKEYFQAYFELEGKIIYYDSKDDVFTYENTNYLRDINILLPYDEKSREFLEGEKLNFFFNFWLLEPSQIYDFMVNGTIDKKNEYGTGEIETTYSDPLSALTKVYKNYNNEISDSINEIYFKLQFLEDDKEIKNVKIDLSSYYELVKKEKKEYLINILYK